jgi:hypothetical protein
MINISMEHNRDACIRTELGNAQVKVEPLDGTTILGGTLGVWTFRRAQCHWNVSAPDGEGISNAQSDILLSRWTSQRTNSTTGGEALDPVPSKMGTFDKFQIKTQEGLNIFAAFMRELKEG